LPVGEARKAPSLHPPAPAGEDAKALPRALTVADPRRGRRIGHMPERGEYGGDGVLGLVRLLLLVAGVALPGR